MILTMFKSIMETAGGRGVCDRLWGWPVSEEYLGDSVGRRSFGDSIDKCYQRDWQPCDEG